jgi:2-methylcitrate dehydratase PrpD
MTLAQNISAFVLNTDFDSFGNELVEKAKEHVLDTLGVLVAASADSLMGILDGFLTDLGPSDGATILGVGKRTSVTNAALVNGILAHGLDYDDSSWRLIGHPSAAVLPAVLAIGEQQKSSGRDLLCAYVLGTEVSCKVGQAAEPELYEEGWHATGVVGVLGATTASAYLLHLTEAQLVNALGIAASLACGLRQNFGSLTKPFHAGAAAHHGIIAALLAKNGFTSNSTSLEGKAGFFHNFTGGRKSVESLSLGSPFDMLDPGFFVKPFPSCAATHTAIEATLNLVVRHKLQPADIQKVYVGSGPVGPIMLVHRQPKTGFEGKFSMPFVVAMAIKNGRIGFESFTDENANHSLVRQLIAKTEFCVDPKFAGRPIDKAPAAITITTTDGQVLTEFIEDPLGSPTRPMTGDVLKLKVRDCFERRLTSESIDSAIELLDTLEALPDVSQLIQTLVFTTKTEKRWS